MKPWKKANRCPPDPASAALIVKAMVLTRRVLSPTASVAIGFSRTARKARPQGECIRLRSMSVVNASMKTISTNCRSSGSRVPNDFGARYVEDALGAAGDIRPLDEDAADDDAESDGHHREVRPLELERRDGDQNARRAREHLETGNADQKPKPSLVASSAPR